MQFDLRDILKRLWEMKGWGRALIVVTGIAGILFFVSFYTECISRLWMGVMFFLLLGTLIISSFEVTRRTKTKLSRLVFEGEEIKARLTAESGEFIDRYDLKISEWASRCKTSMSMAEYDLWKSNTGIEKPESEDEQQGDIKQNLAIKRNYIHIRIIRLKEIINKL